MSVEEITLNVIKENLHVKFFKKMMNVSDMTQVKAKSWHKVTINI